MDNVKEQLEKAEEIEKSKQPVGKRSGRPPGLGKKKRGRPPKEKLTTGSKRGRPPKKRTFVSRKDKGKKKLKEGFSSDSGSDDQEEGEEEEGLEVDVEEEEEEDSSSEDKDDEPSAKRLKGEKSYGKRQWLPAEDAKLRRLLNKLGKNYNAIHEKFPERSINSLRSRGERLLKKMNSYDEDTPAEETKEEADYYHGDSEHHVDDDGSIPEDAKEAERERRNKVMRKDKRKKALKVSKENLKKMKEGAHAQKVEASADVDELKEEEDEEDEKNEKNEKNECAITYLPRILQCKDQAALPLGSYVLTRFEGQQFFKGMVDQIKDNRLHINYSDGDTEWCNVRALRGSVFPVSRSVFQKHVDGSVLWPKVGSQIEVKWGVGRANR